MFHLNAEQLKVLETYNLAMDQALEEAGAVAATIVSVIAFEPAEGDGDQSLHHLFAIAPEGEEGIKVMENAKQAIEMWIATRNAELAPYVLTAHLSSAKKAGVS